MPAINIPIVSAIIERKHNGKTEVLIQTRWKPDRDPEYSGTIEIPAGWIDRYESVYDALRREVGEETGLGVVKLHPDLQTKIYSPREWRICVRSLVLPVTDQGRQAADRFRIFV